MRPEAFGRQHMRICNRFSNSRRNQPTASCSMHRKPVKTNAGQRKSLSDSELPEDVEFYDELFRRDFALGQGSRNMAEEPDMSSLSLRAAEQSMEFPLIELLEIYRRQHGLECQSLKIRPQERDGNCFFRCLSDHFTGRPDNHLVFRKLVVEYLKSLYIDRHPVPLPEISVEEHVEYMLQPNTWATECEIYAAAHMFNLRIDILTGGRGSPYMWATTVPIDADPSSVLKCLRLLHRDRVHFDLIQEEW